MTTQFTTYLFSSEEAEAMQDYISVLEEFTKDMRLQADKMDLLILKILFGEREEV